MRIAVLVKQVPDTEDRRELDIATGRIDREASAVLDQINEVALEVALQCKDADKGTEVVAICLGPTQARDALRTCLAMGADRAIHVVDSRAGNADAMLTARILTAAVHRCEPGLVLAGNESTDGKSGVVPAAIAELLAWPYLPSVEAMELTGDQVRGTVREEGSDIDLSARLPALVAVTERAAEARFPTLRGIMSAKRKPTDELDLAQLGYGGDAGAASLVRSVAERPARAGGVLVQADDGAVDTLVEFLASRRLI